MTWQEAGQIALIVIGALGGGGVIAVGLFKFAGDLFTQRYQGDIDRGLRRLDARLEHGNYLLQRFSEFELEAVVACWRAARKCVPLINATRPSDSGTNLTELNERYQALAAGHNDLLLAMGEHELFLSKELMGTLEIARRALALELSNITHHEKFVGSWWDEGQRNRAEFAAALTSVRDQMREVTAKLRSEIAEDRIS